MLKVAKRSNNKVAMIRVSLDLDCFHNNHTCDGLPFEDFPSLDTDVLDEDGNLFTGHQLLDRVDDELSTIGSMK